MSCQPEFSDSPARLCDAPQGSRAAVIAVAAMLVAGVALVFIQTSRYKFVNFDDDRYVYDNPHINSGLTLQNVWWVTIHRHSHNWHPLTGLSHLIDCQFYHYRSGGHHLTNVILHAASAVLLMLVLRRMTGRLWPSALTAALFAVHPLRVESVAWVSERKDVLSGLFFMLTLYAYERYVRLGRDPLRYVLVVVLFIGGLMSKPMVVTVPFVLLLLDYWPLGRFQPGDPATVAEYDAEDESPGLLIEDRFFRFGRFLWRLLIPGPLFLKQLALLALEKLPLFVLSAASCGLTVYVQGDAVQTVESVPLASRCENALISYAEYLGVFFFPRRLAVLYPHPTSDVRLDHALMAAAGILIVSAVTLLLARRWPVLIVGWLWYLGMLVPVIGLVQVGGQSMADRYTYLPQIGIAMALAFSGDALFAKGPLRTIAFVAASCIVAVLAAGAWQQTAVWRDSESLWTRDVSMYGQRNAVGYYNLGMTLAEKERYDEAIAEYHHALEVSPDDRDTFINLGLSQAGLHRYDEAIQSYRKAIAADSSVWQAHKNLGLALREQGKLSETLKEWKLAVDLCLDQDHEEMPDILWSTAWILATTPDDALRDPAEAIKWGERGAQATAHRDPVVLDALAAAYASAGRFSDAIATDRNALELLSGDAKSNAKLMGEIRKRLTLYEAGKPFRDAK